MRTYLQKSRVALAAVPSGLVTALVLGVSAAPALARSASPEVAGHGFGVPARSGGAVGFVPLGADLHQIHGRRRNRGPERIAPCAALTRTFHSRSPADEHQPPSGARDRLTVVRRRAGDAEGHCVLTDKSYVGTGAAGRRPAQKVHR
jgi:hypothetical protein